MFRDPEKPGRPMVINELTAPEIILDAIEEYLGGEALDSEMEPENITTARALKDLEKLAEALWIRYGRNERWGDLAEGLERRLQAKKEWLERFKSKRKECKIS